MSCSQPAFLSLLGKVFCRSCSILKSGFRARTSLEGHCIVQTSCKGGSSGTEPAVLTVPSLVHYWSHLLFLYLTPLLSLKQQLAAIPCCVQAAREPEIAPPPPPPSGPPLPPSPKRGSEFHMEWIRDCSLCATVTGPVVARVRTSLQQHVRAHVCVCVCGRGGGGWGFLVAFLGYLR